MTSDAEFTAALIGAFSSDWIDGFKAGWRSSGEGYNGEYPDEGKTWVMSAGREAMLREMRAQIRGEVS